MAHGFRHYLSSLQCDMEPEQTAATGQRLDKHVSSAKDRHGAMSEL
jgi:hypothetical protein